MTLNITVATEKRIYQCADYRITDLVTGKPEDLPHQQKIFFAYANTWTATVCFNGLGRTSTKLEVSSWLNDVCIAAMRTREESLDDFLSQLQTADSWLSQESRQDRRHSFLVAAFVGRRRSFL
jgi:hypothetical protein